MLIPVTERTRHSDSLRDEVEEHGQALSSLVPAFKELELHDEQELLERALGRLSQVLQSLDARSHEIEEREEAPAG